VRSTWACDAACLPIDDERLRREALAGLRLPAQVPADGPDQVDVELPPRLDQDAGVEIAGVDQMLRRQEVVRHGPKPGTDGCFRQQIAPLNIIACISN
jgi:hypothetical protein